MKQQQWRLRRLPSALCLALACALHGYAPAAFAAAPAVQPGGIGWQVASSDAEVDRAFQLARQTGKPVFLYWGAVWCPPCNQVKATLFNRADFIERTRAFVPVYVDGDKPGAQKVASRFKVSGYPTMVLFKPDGSEVTRLPGEVDPERYLLTLAAGLDAQAPVAELVRRATARQALTPEQWRLLSYYSWDTDHQQVVRDKELPGTLERVAEAAPAELPRVRDRLLLKALQARADSGKDTPTDSQRALADRLLADPAAARDMSDLFLYSGPAVVKYLGADPAARAALASRWDAALESLLASGRLSRTERVDALGARIGLWNYMDGTTRLGARRQAGVKEAIARLVAETTDRYERQSVVPSAAHVLAEAGLVGDSDAMVRAELPRAVAPYYHMLVLGANAKARGDKAAALQWYQEAWRKSEGPATRLQWGTSYIRNLVELAPGDLKRISTAVQAVVGELEPVTETFYERNERSLQRLARTLQAWQGQDAARAKVVTAMRDTLGKTCARLPAGDVGRTNCEAVVASASAQRPA